MIQEKMYSLYQYLKQRIDQNLDYLMKEINYRVYDTNV